MTNARNEEEGIKPDPDAKFAFWLILPVVLIIGLVMLCSRLVTNQATLIVDRTSTMDAGSSSTGTTGMSTSSTGAQADTSKIIVARFLDSTTYPAGHV